MNKMAIGFLALIVLCVVMWLMSVARRRQRQGLRTPGAYTGRYTGTSSVADSDAALSIALTGSFGGSDVGSHHHQPADCGASSAHGGHFSGDVGGGHCDGGASGSH